MPKSDNSSGSKDPTSAETWMWGKRLAAMLAVKRSVGVTPQVNLKEHTSRTPLPSVHEGTHSAFENQRRHQQKSETVVSVASQKDMCPPKIKIYAQC